MRKALFPALLALILLVGCTTKTQPPSPAPSSQEEVTGYTLLDAKTAVLTADATLTDCYSYTLREGYGTPGTDDDQFYLWITLDSEQALSQGDIVAILEEKDGISRVVIPYGDLPWLYGYLPSELLSTGQADIETGNQAILIGCDTYDTPNGTKLHPKDARARILSYEEEWVKVREYGTGEDPYWVQAADLCFDFSSTVPDWPQ